MHGRPREYKNKLKDPKAQEAYKKKVDAIRTGTAVVLECRRAKRYDEAALVASAKLLRVVPEIYTLWNFRREAVGSVLAAGDDVAKKAADEELSLTQACLKENPKSYSTWHHRKWVVGQGLASLQAELKLVSSALDADQRNFHAWAYRQFIVKLMQRPAEDELQYTEDKIIQNFSNYSAWHYRTVVLHKLHCSAAEQQEQQQQQQQPGAGSSTGGQAAAADASESYTGTSSVQASAAAASAAALPSNLGAYTGSASQHTPVPVEVLDEEYDMVHQAFATDSQDQSPWMYYRWLVGNSLAHLEAAKGTEEEDAARAVLAAVLEREIGRFESDHLASSPEQSTKWPLLTVARLKEAQANLGLCGVADPEEVKAQVRTIYERLIAIDPMRSGYYKDALEGKAFVVVSALGTV